MEMHIYHNDLKIIIQMIAFKNLVCLQRSTYFVFLLIKKLML